jgi:hypothetical protein
MADLPRIPLAKSLIAPSGYRDRSYLGPPESYDVRIVPIENLNVKQQHLTLKECDFVFNNRLRWKHELFYHGGASLRLV